KAPPVVSGVPDVARVPGATGAPVPIPYPNIGSSGEKDPAAKKQPVLKNDSKFKKTTGDEAGTLKGKKAAVFKKRNDELKKQVKDQRLADKKNEVADKWGPSRKLEPKKPIEVVKPDVPKPAKVPPVDVVKRPLPPTPPLRPVDVP